MIVMAVTTPEENRLLFSSISAGLVTFLFFAGALAAAAMIIPGVSGSFLLLALGVYYPVVSAVSDLLDAAVLFLRGGYPDTGALLADIVLPFFTLLPFGVGVIAGLFTGAALVRLVLRKAAAVTYGAILGLVAGSVAVVFPREGFDGVFLVILSLACGLAGGALSFLFSRRELASTAALR